MPNLRGPGDGVRRAYAHAVLSGALYGAPIWHGEARTSRRIRKNLHSVQRRLALQIARTYRIVARDALAVFVGIPPPEYVADSLVESYARAEAIRLRGNVVTLQPLQRGGPSAGFPRMAQQPAEQPADQGNPNHGGHPSLPGRVLTGHWCFGEYLCRIGKELTARCHHHDEPRDTAQHTLEVCPAWAQERGVLRREIGEDLSLPAVVRAMVGRERAWTAVSFCSSVIRQKEEVERGRERAPRGGPHPPPPPD
ncbi:PREDICTED: uncharacterized protein LOC108765488 [Trachymyrmex cornetzi]|uniref:uncharacterized protein LOC108765488 n=1 Tax=Trachymyrmex cornetzi TaxID=471704 RepID=UPI00084F1BBD|nr:PREDICTED: uncharacterized protein LOC108765488 [Trachymyrmex cornetzi]